MSTTSRTWIAGCMLALSAIILSLAASPVGLGVRAGLGMFVLFAHVFLVAVGERSCTSRGGLRIKRFPLAPRLIRTDPHLFPQFLVLIVVLWFVARSLGLEPAMVWTVPAVALVAVTVLSVDLLRKIAPFLLPVVALVFALVTMEEFHTLGDLLDTVKTWIDLLLKFILISVVLLGPTLRTDVAPPYKRMGTVGTLVAGVPTYLGAVYIVTQTTLGANLGPFARDMFAIALMLLVGGLLQSLLAGLFGRSGELIERDPDFVPSVNGHRVGQALMPMLVPLIAFLMLFVMPLEGQAAAADPRAWAGVFAMLMWIPLVPAAALVADALDRVDGPERLNADGPQAAAAAGRAHRATRPVALALFALWFFLGPYALVWFYAPGGMAHSIGQALHLSAETVATHPDGSQELLLYGLPAGDLLRAVTVMVFVAAFLSVRYVRYARRGFHSVGWPSLLLLLALQVGTSFWLVPRVGPSGAALAGALAAVVLLVVNFFGQKIRFTAEAAAQMALEQAAEEDQIQIPDTI